MITYPCKRNGTNVISALISLAHVCDHRSNKRDSFPVAIRFYQFFVRFFVEYDVGSMDDQLDSEVFHVFGRACHFPLQIPDFLIDSSAQNISQDKRIVQVFAS